MAAVGCPRMLATSALKYTEVQSAEARPLWPASVLPSRPRPAHGTRLYYSDQPSSPPSFVLFLILFSFWVSVCHCRWFLWFSTAGFFDLPNKKPEIAVPCLVNKNVMLKSKDIYLQRGKNGSPLIGVNSESYVNYPEKIVAL